MLSRALPNETIDSSSSYVPARIKSAYARRNQFEEKEEELGDHSCKCKKNKYLSQSLYFPQNGSGASSNYDSSSSSTISSSNQFVAPSAHDVVRARNTEERIRELEKSNTNLKRMLQFVSNDPSKSIDRMKSAVPRLLTHRTNINNSLGPPQLRQGRIGSNWRHIKQTNNYGNSNLLFIDGTVRLNDSCKYPATIYGYPPKIVDYDEDLIGIHTRKLNESDLPGPTQRVRNRQADMNAYNNQFHERAKQGFTYWTKDSREPENNKNKAPSIAIGHPYFKPGF